MSYWKDRQAEAQARLSQKNIKDIEKQLAKYYQQAAAHCITSFENTYNKLLSTLDDGRTPTPADLYKLDTYWQMQAQIKKELDKLGNKEIELFMNAFVKNYQNVYDSIAFKGLTAYTTIDREAIEQVITAIWCADGKNWSGRIWSSKERLMETLNEELIAIVGSGKKTTDLKNKLQQRFGVSYSQADSIARTEIAHIQTEAAKQRYKDYGINKVQIWADKDERRCELCGQLHEKIYPVGANIPIPAHPRCRCTIIPYDEIFFED